MAKDLPYFKFFCSEWNDGDVTLEDYNIQGLFINVCSYYWSNECYVSIDKLKKRFKHNVEDIIYLFKVGLIHNENGYVEIHFLDEQKAERDIVSKRNSEAGKKSAERRRQQKQQQDFNENSTGVEIMFNENSTNKKREEKKREEKKIDDFNIFWSKYPKKVAKEKSKNIFIKLPQTEIDKILATIDNFISFKPFKEYNHPNPTTYLNQKRWEDELKTKKEFDDPTENIVF